MGECTLYFLQISVMPSVMNEWERNFPLPLTQCSDSARKVVCGNMGVQSAD